MRSFYEGTRENIEQIFQVGILPFIFTFEQCVVGIKLSVNVTLESHFIAEPGEIWPLKLSNKTSQLIILII